MTQPELHHAYRSCDVLYRDMGLFAINKPAGLPVHGSKILEDTPETLLSRVRKQEGDFSHLVHRLDRPVSGVVLFTGNRDMLAEMGKLFENRCVRKRYLAVVRGWTEPEGLISHPLRPPRDERKASSVAREALTRYECIARIELPIPVPPYSASRYSLLGLYPETGRRHQLRMHMKHVSHHLIGDTTYGRGEHNRLFRENFSCKRLLLHAWSVEFNHPEDGQKVCVHAPLDTTFSNIIESFGWDEALRSWAASSSDAAGTEDLL